MDSSLNLSFNRKLALALKASFGKPDKFSEVISEIERISQEEKTLTPRGVRKLEELANSGNLAQITQDELLIGWAVVEPLTSNYAEVGLVYIKPQYRSAEVFNQLMKLLATRPERMILATYDASLIRYVKHAWKAKQVSLLQVILLSRGKFITKRLDKQSRKAIRQKLEADKPLYAIVGER